MKSEKLWRSLNELYDAEELRESLQDEFPPEASAPVGFIDRREFLTLMSASLALAGLSSCAPSAPEKIERTRHHRGQNR